MRISTNAMHLNALRAMLSQQTALSRTQDQIASGRRVLSPADDPIAAVHIIELERALAESAQFTRNANLAANRLSLEEQALADAGQLLQRVRDLTVQANTATIDQSSLEMIATELRSLLEGLIDVANRRDAHGEYLFAGYSSSAQPFALTGGGVTYHGDQGVRLVQIAPSQRVADSHSGYDVFMSVREGNGTFVTEASATNTGTGIIDPGTVLNHAAWVADDYTLTFTAADTWEVTDSGGTVIATGTYTPDAAIEFNGVRVSITGQPAAGDSFTIRSSRTEDMFAVIGDIIASLREPVASAADRALRANRLTAALVQIDQNLDHLSRLRAEVGARLSAVENSQTFRDDLELQLQTTLSELRDLDYAEALTRLNQQYVGLQAAQLSYSQIARLSLFNYL